MNEKVICLLLLAALAFAMITNIVAVLDMQSTSEATSTRATSCNDDPEVEPIGDPVGGVPCPKNDTGS